MSLVFVVALLITAGAPPSDAAKLFDEGRAALKAGDVEAACRAFDRSYALEPALGALLNLASCLERKGTLVRAWLRFNDAVAWAQRTHEAERESYARTHAQNLKGRLSWLALSAAEEVDAEFDEQPLRLGPVPVSVPVERGTHQLVVAKDGFQRYTRTVPVTTPGTTYERVPPLTPDTRPVAETKAPIVSPVNSTPQPGLQFVEKRPAVSAHAPFSAGGITLVLAGSAAGIVGGVGLGWSFSAYDRLQRQRMAGANATDIVSLDDYNRLKWIYPSSWVAIGGGAALATIGTIILVASNHGRVTLVPNVGGLALAGTF